MSQGSLGFCSLGGLPDGNPSADPDHLWTGHFAVNVRSGYKGTTPVWVGATSVPPWVSWTGLPEYVNTSEWVNASGTIFIFESFRACSGWRNGWNSGQYAPMEALAHDGTHGYGTVEMESWKYWQDKHLGMADLTFCDGHGEQLPMAETIGAGVDMSEGAAAVGGLWTRDRGD